MSAGAVPRAKVFKPILKVNSDPPAPPAPPGDAARAGDTERAPSCAKRLVEIGQKSQLFSDERGDAYAQIKDSGKSKILRVHSTSFRRWLSGAYYKAGGGVANAEALRGAVEVLEHQAIYDGERFDLHNRFSRKDGAVWLDLCDERGRAVRVTADGWDIVDEPPILFRHFPHQAPLPAPVKGGDLRDFLPRINVARPEDGMLILAWLVTAPFVDIPRPILCFHGPQGSAKSTAARMLRALLDPSAVESTALRRDEAELAQVLDHHAVPLFDNLGGISSAQADLLCCAVTGGGFSKRVLFTDDDDVLRAFKRAILMTAITVPTVAPDLLDRTLLVELQRVSPDKRRTEAELWSAFNVERPRLLGGLLDALSGALRMYPSVKIDRLPRMADFGRWGAAAAEALGFGSQAFLGAYAGNVKAQLDEIIESDPVAAAVCELAKVGVSWIGSPTELLKILTASRGQGTPGDGWPKTPGKLSGRLRRLQTTLTDAGIGVRWTKDEAGHRGRAITIQALATSSGNLSSLASLSSPLDGDAPASVATIETLVVASVAGVVAELPLKNKDNDACDTSDDKKWPLVASEGLPCEPGADPELVPCEAPSRGSETKGDTHNTHNSDRFP